MKSLKENHRERMGVFLAMPVILYMIVFFVIPSLLVFVYSFWESKSFQLVPTFQLGNYEKILTSRAVALSLWTGVKIGLATAIISTALSYPVAWYIAFRTRSNVILYLVLLSWFSSYLVRIFAWRTILGTNGLINSTLMSLGVINEPLEFLIFNANAVAITLVHIFVPFTLLLLLSALRNITPDVLDAARDLGASRLRVFAKVTLPMAYKGFFGSFIFTFILATGDFITPQLLGGRNGVTFGYLISNQFRVTGNWPLGAAMAFTLLAVFLALYALLTFVGRWIGVAPGQRFHAPIDTNRKPIVGEDQ